ncbi:MAG: hypothetical protein IAG13_19940 [Deltaproteobacteria bacterium]|nr:hypothetical protein [Nannocystaceae bacterium]
MRRLALPFSLIVAACGDDVSPQTTDTDDESDSSSSSPSTLGGSESGSSESTAADESSTTDPTVDPTTESSSSDATIDPSSSSGEAPAVCGDGEITGEEICDGNNYADNTCQSQGFQSGVLTCSPDCLGFSTSQCFICGDADVEGTEECDGPLDGEMSCEALGFTEGPINCDMSTCQLDVSGCTFCGDGVAEGNEFCDLDDLFGENCDTLGFTGGQLGCNADTCGYDYTDCEGGQYLQDFEGCDLPPEFTFTGTADWTADATNPITGACSAHNLDIGESQTAGMVLTTIWAIAGTCDFMYRTDSEGSFDYLEFYVDGILLNSWSGVGGVATPASFPITAGNHTLEWRFIKDGSVTSGTDTVWVDDIVLFGGVPI